MDAGGSGSGGPPDKKPAEDLGPPVVGSVDEAEAMTLIAALVSLVRLLYRLVVGENANVPAQASTSAIPASAVPEHQASFRSSTPRYYTVFVGREIGVFDDW